MGCKETFNLLYMEEVTRTWAFSSGGPCSRKVFLPLVAISADAHPCPTPFHDPVLLREREKGKNGKRV